jgi:RimJ/RimL family protein N-acetyltransferase
VPLTQFVTTIATEVERDTMRVVLDDGREVTIRPLGHEDGPALEAAFRRADPWDLRRRFMGMPPPVSWLLRQLDKADGIHDLPIGAFTDEGRLVGVAQFDRSDDGPRAEVAIEVAKDWQHAGLGTKLLTKLAEMALVRGVHEFTATYYADNIAIRRLLHEVGHVVDSGFDSGEGYARLDLDAAS